MSKSKKAAPAAPEPAPRITTPGLYGDYELSRIRISPDNRKRFNETALNELAESIKSIGIAQPILIRPVTPTDEAPEDFEIVAGERRYRASKIAGRDTIPAVLRDLSDLDAAKLRILENLQREDPHPMEEAEGYQLLMLQHGYNADQLADEVKKSRAYIYGRLKLCSLSTEVREEFLSNKVSASTALLIARIPVPELQAKALYEIQRPYANMTVEPMSHRKAMEHLQARYMLDLTKAVFKITDARLLPAAGACGPCAKRTGNQPELFEGISADVCTDPECFSEKRGAHHAALVMQAKKEGIPIAEGVDRDLIQDRRWASDSDLVKSDTHVTRFSRNAPTTGNAGTAAHYLGENGLPPVATYTKEPDGLCAWYKRSDMQAALEVAGACETIEQHAERMVVSAINPAAEQPRKQTAADEALEQADVKAKAETTFRVALYKQMRAKGAADGFSLASLREFTKLAVCTHPLPDDLLGDVYDFEASSDAAVCTYIDGAGLPAIQLLLIDLLVGETLSVDAHYVKNGMYLEDNFATVIAMARHEGIDADQVRDELFPSPINIGDMQEFDLATFIRKYPARLAELTEAVLAHPRVDLIGMLERAAQQCGYTYTRGGFVLQDAAQADVAPTEIDPFLNQVIPQERGGDAVALAGESLAEQIVDAAPEPKRTKGKATGKKLAPAVAWPFPKDSSGEREPEATTTTTPQTEATQEIAA